MSSSGHGPIPAYIVMPAALADETLGRPINALGYTYHTFYIVGTGTVSTGILTIEEAPSVDFTGTWSVIGTPTDFSTTSVGSGATAAVHVAAGNYAALRARISTVIGGTGTITVYHSAH